MRLSPVQAGRAAGVLLGQAIGDALGVPFEFQARITAGTARMIGGGLGPYAPGEWSDDTQLAVCIAEVAATGADLTGDAALDAVAQRFLDWQVGGASDIGIQTGAVLSAARSAAGPPAARLTDAARAAARSGSPGNGALMRTAIVGLTALDDPEATAEAARRVAALTHADDRCLDSCVLWSEAVRVAVVEGRLDVRGGVRLLPEGRQSEWATLLDEAESRPPAAFVRNGYTVTALQAAWSAIHATRHLTGPDHVEAALQEAIAIGHDTDTVAAIAGGLLGTRYGVPGLPSDLTRRVHGWPGLRERDLIALALGTAGGTDPTRWPWRPSMIRGLGRPLAVSHPEDPEVLLGTEADLARCRELGVTAVVSLSRLSATDADCACLAPGKHAAVWLVDSDDPADNPWLTWTLTDAARTVQRLRDEGERVLLHCVAAHHRTPSVALAYSRLLGLPAAEAAGRIAGALGVRDIGGLLWHTACTL